MFRVIALSLFCGVGSCLDLMDRHRKLALRVLVPESRVSVTRCEACHSLPRGSALFVSPVKLTPIVEDGKMKTRRMAYWWFRFVISGRFLEKFLKLRKASQS
jgi:hypothetical protein